MESSRPSKRRKTMHNEGEEKNLKHEVESESDEIDMPSIRSSGRQRRAPRRFSDDMIVVESKPRSKASTPRPVSKTSTPRPRTKGRTSKSAAKDVVMQDVLEDEVNSSSLKEKVGDDRRHTSEAIEEHGSDQEREDQPEPRPKTQQSKKQVRRKTPKTMKKDSSAINHSTPLPQTQRKSIGINFEPLSINPERGENILYSTESAKIRSSRRRNNFTDNFGNAHDGSNNEFENAIRGNKPSTGDEKSPHTEAHRLAEVKSSIDLPFLPLIPRIPPFQAASKLEGLSPHELVRQVVLEKLTGRRPIPLIGLEEEYEKIHTLIEQTVLAGEGNSMLVIGARGSGKTALVNAILRNLSGKSREQYHVIRLSGFIQIDDKLALREIWRQLGQEMEVDEGGPAKNYADTLSSLLALLSHSPDTTEENASHVARSVIFIIDEFDLFTAHPRQTLLYNLFDIAQSRKAPIAVLGLTTRVDVVESLEKRVKSRFSHRYVHLGLPKSLAIFQQICKSALQVDPEEDSVKQQLSLKTGHDGSVVKTPHKLKGLADIHLTWNRSVEAFLTSSDISRLLSQVFHTSKSIPTVLMAFHIPVLLSDGMNLEPSSFRLDALMQAPDSKLTILPSLSTLALALLISAARLDIILDTDTCNFNMVYDEYSSLAAKARLGASTTAAGIGIGGKIWGQEVARAAWERLLEVELLIPAVGTGSGMGAGDMVRCDVALEEIEGVVPDLDRALEKWCREI